MPPLKDPAIMLSSESPDHVLLPYPPEVRTAEAAPERRARARNIPIEAAIIERYRRGDGTVEETMLELYQAGISVRRAEAVARILWGAQVDAATVSEFNQRIADRIARWRLRPIRGQHPYVFLGAIDLQCRWGGENRNIRVLAAAGVNAQGLREVLGVAAGARRDAHAWCAFLRHLQARGLAGVRLFISDSDPGIDAATAVTYPAAGRQVCLWQLQREVHTHVAIAQLSQMPARFEAIINSETPEAARTRTRQAAAELRQLRLPAAAAVLERAGDSAASYLAFPREHWKRLRSNFALMKILRQIRERTRIVGAFSDDDSAVLMVSARLRYVADQWLATPHHWDMSSFAPHAAEPDGAISVPPRRIAACYYGAGVGR